VDKDIVTKQWHAMTKMAGLWKRPDVTAMVIQFFSCVLYLLSLGLEVKYRWVIEGKWKFTEIFIKE
jgi:hypothetical protein